MCTESGRERHGPYGRPHVGSVENSRLIRHEAAPLHVSGVSHEACSDSTRCGGMHDSRYGGGERIQAIARQHGILWTRWRAEADDVIRAGAEAEQTTERTVSKRCVEMNEHDANAVLL